jgi:hypothetical protein
MGLRDRGFVIDYYIPLFAGVDAAKRDRFRTRFLWDVFAPYYTGGGTGTGGGIGGGDGGFGTPSDFSIHTPSITYPDESEFLCIGVCSTITADAFASDNGQAHVGSRWMIELMNSVPGGGDPYLCTQYHPDPGTGFDTSLWYPTETAACAAFGVWAGWHRVDGITGTHTCSGLTSVDTPASVTIASRTGLYCSDATCNVPTTGTGIYVYDSGPDAVHLTSLPLADITIPANSAFRVMVRYKGSDGGWSDWSVNQSFSLGTCEPCS